MGGSGDRGEPGGAERARHTPLNGIERLCSSNDRTPRTTPPPSSNLQFRRADADHSVVSCAVVSIGPLARSGAEAEHHDGFLPIRKCVAGRPLQNRPRSFPRRVRPPRGPDRRSVHPGHHLARQERFLQVQHHRLRPQVAVGPGHVDDRRRCPLRCPRHRLRPSRIRRTDSTTRTGRVRRCQPHASAVAPSTRR
jgi:hypothetical protein